MFRLTGEVLRSVVAKVHLTDIYYIATQYSKIVTNKEIKERVVIITCIRM